MFPRCGHVAAEARGACTGAEPHGAFPSNSLLAGPGVCTWPEGERSQWPLPPAMAQGAPGSPAWC